VVYPAMTCHGPTPVKTMETTCQSSVYGWDVDGCMVILRRGHGPPRSEAARRWSTCQARLSRSRVAVAAPNPATTGAIGWQRLPRPAISPSLRARPG